jgi:protein-tyrosine phosphatase
MIDIHSHVIWDVDDGAPTPEISLEMLRAACKSGTSHIVATPHMNSQFEFSPELCHERMRQLSETDEELPVIHLGCEFHLSVDNVDRLMKDPFRYTINGKQYFLMECPDLHIGKHAEAVVTRLIDSGLVPIVAHPERNPVFQRDPARLGSWVDLGCLTQLTSLSVTGDFGRSTAVIAAKMLEKGLIHVVASDAHDPKFRHACLDKSFALIEARYGSETAAILFEDNPRCVIEGHPVPGGRQISEGAANKWWQFWRPKSDYS